MCIRDSRGRAQPHRRQARAHPRRALVRRLPQAAGSTHHHARPLRSRTRRLLRHHRPDRHQHPDRLPLRRSLVHRGLPPRRQTGPRRREPAVLETPRTRTRSRPVALATRHDLVLVPRTAPGRQHLDPPTLVPQKTTQSFLDALASLRPVLWSQRITAMSAASTPGQDKTRITDALLDTLAYAAL